MLENSAALCGEIKERIDGLRNTGRLSTIEKECVMEKMRRLYDLFIQEYNTALGADCKESQLNQELKEPQSEQITKTEPTSQEVVLEVQESPSPQFSYYGPLSIGLSQEQMQKMCDELFEGDISRAGDFMTSLDDCQDLDQAVFFIQDTVPGKLNSESVSIIANALTNKLL